MFVRPGAIESRDIFRVPENSVALYLLEAGTRMVLYFLICYTRSFLGVSLASF